MAMKIQKNSLKNAAFLAVLLCGAMDLTACKKEEAASANVRPVRAITVAQQEVGESLSLTGQVAARNTINASFRISGKMVERLVSVGDEVKSGQILARLDLKTETDTLNAANADVGAAKALLEQAEKTEKRTSTLVKLGTISQSADDDAVRQLKAAQAQLSAAQARQHSAQEQLAYTTLLAEADGIVTETGAEPSETVGAGQMIVRLAQYQQKDAVFDAPESVIRRGLALQQEIDVRPVAGSTSSIKAVIREISPQADASTRTYLVKAALISPPPAMLLGSTIVGDLHFLQEIAIAIPATALTLSEGSSAVWVVNAGDKTVSLKKVTISRYDAASAIVTQGLQSGDVVVTAGVQVLHSGQKVRLLEK